MTFRLARQNQHQEHTVQEQVVRYLFRIGCRTIETDVMDALKYLSPKYTDTPKEKLRKEQEKQKYILIHKSRGYINGQPDLVVLRPNGQILLVEMKKPDGVQSPAQKDFQRQVEFMGHEYVVWRSLSDAVKYFNKCGNNITTGADVSAFTSTPPTLNAE